MLRCLTNFSCLRHPHRMQGPGTTAIEGILLAEALAAYPDAIVYDQTDKVRGLIVDEIEL